MAVSKVEKKVPRPMNCFLAFRLEKQGEITSLCPGANHRDISKIIAKWWKELSDEEKAPYRERAKLAKIEHAKMYPDYKYCPKKKDSRKPRKYSRQTQSNFTSRKEENDRIMEMLYENPRSLQQSREASLSPERSADSLVTQTTLTRSESSVDSSPELSSCYSTVSSPSATSSTTETPFFEEQFNTRVYDATEPKLVYQESPVDQSLPEYDECDKPLIWQLATLGNYYHVFTFDSYNANYSATPLYINPQLLTLNANSQCKDTKTHDTRPANNIFNNSTCINHYNLFQ